MNPLSFEVFKSGETARPVRIMVVQLPASFASLLLTKEQAEELAEKLEDCLRKIIP